MFYNFVLTQLAYFASDTLVRQASMILKCFLLMYYKNSRGRNYRKQVSVLLFYAPLSFFSLLSSDH